MINPVHYKIKDASQKDLFEHFKKCNGQFLERLNQRVNLLSYCKKLHKNAVTFEAWNDSKLVGVVSVYLNNKESAIGFISNVSVVPAFERRGIASRLINMAIERARKLEFLELCLDVHSGNATALSFYRKHGFIVTSRTEKEITMCCKI